MKKLCLIFGAAVLMSNINAYSQNVFNPPQTKKAGVTEDVHGFKFTDYYRWLETKEDPEVKTWSHAQHQATVDFVTQKTKEIKGLKQEIVDYLSRDYKGAPFFEGEREFFYSRKKGEQQNKLYAIVKGKEVLIFDPVKLDPSGKTAITSADFTRDGSKVAIGVQSKGDEILTVRIYDTKNGKQIGEQIDGLNGFNWAFDEDYAYISIRTKEMIKNQKPVETYLHKVSAGNDRSKDVFMIAPKDAKDVAGTWDSEDGEFTFSSEGDFYSNTLKIKPRNAKEEAKTIFSSKEFHADAYAKNGKLWIRTNYKSPNWKLMIADYNKPEFENWKDFIPEQEGIFENYVLTSDYVIVKIKKDVLSKLYAYDFNGKLIKEIQMPELGEVGGISYHKESNSVFVGLSTFGAPSKSFRMDGKTLEMKFYYQEQTPVNTKDIESKLVFYKSKDGTSVPLFLVYKKGVKLDGNNPTLLYGYGGFNISQSPGFIGTTASFINRGGVYALACLRGGAEYGEKWHRDGMLFKKQNTFDDCIAAAEYLISEKYTNPNKLSLKGGSNGGLLVGAVITQRPDLFKASICAVPLLDMVRYHKFLIARYWIPEYGDPDKKEDFLNIWKYSPYHNIKPGINYPTTMVKAGENDSRVDALHAKKFAAALQNNPGQTNPILLFIDFESGHGSGQSIDQMAENTALEWRFLMNELGME